MAHFLGDTLLVVNPTAQSGRVGEVAGAIESLLERELSAQGSTLRTDLTCDRGDATRFARASEGFDTVVALGGDGVIHEVVNGLMDVPEGRRPQLGIIPMGSGNDYARTLNVAINRPEHAARQLLGGRQQTVDLGRVNETWFMQTLSFGLDAAIALDTQKRRTKNASRGTRLFAASGVDLLVHHGRKRYPYRGQMDGVPIEGASIVFAVQVGPTYGGGFKICPEADPADGLLDVCRTVGSPSLPHALAIFARARLGLHTGSPILRFDRCSNIELTFTDAQPPCQVDGEELVADSYRIECVAQALRVIVPQ